MRQCPNSILFFLILLVMMFTWLKADRVLLNQLDGDESYVRERTRVELGVSIESYSGLIAMDEQEQSALFYWMFPSIRNNTKAPIIVYVEGGPGFSSGLQVFNGIGPLIIDRSRGLQINPATWVNNYTVIYIDNPLDVGFSYCNNPSRLSRTQEQVAQNLYTALSTILSKYPSLQRSDVYLWGESYGGKYIPSFAYKILQEGRKINLAGMAVGNPLSDPITQITAFADFAHKNGLIDVPRREFISNMQNEGVGLIKQEKWMDASIQYFLIAYNISALAGNVSVYDITNYSMDIPYSVDFISYLSDPSVADALHAGSVPYKFFSSDAALALLDDFSQSIISLYPEILAQGVKVLVYNGVYDLLCCAVGVETFVEKINYPDVIQPWIQSQKQFWKVNNSLAGFVKQYKTLTFVWVLESGHFVLDQQPLRSLKLVSHFIENIPFSPHVTKK